MEEAAKSEAAESTAPKINFLARFIQQKIKQKIKSNPAKIQKNPNWRLFGFLPLVAADLLGNGYNIDNG